MRKTDVHELVMSQGSGHLKYLDFKTIREKKASSTKYSGDQENIFNELDWQKVSKIIRPSKLDEVVFAQELLSTEC